jgi:hypothetical protein
VSREIKSHLLDGCAPHLDSVEIGGSETRLFG